MALHSSKVDDALLNPTVGTRSVPVYDVYLSWKVSDVPTETLTAIELALVNGDQILCDQRLQLEEDVLIVSLLRQLLLTLLLSQ